MFCSLLIKLLLENMREVVFFISSVQSLSCVQLFVTPGTAACQASLSITNSRSLLKFLFIQLVMPSNHLILCCPLLQGIFPTQGLNPSLLNCGQILYQLSHQGSQTSSLFLGWHRTPQGEVLFTGPTQTPSEQVQSSGQASF